MDDFTASGKHKKVSCGCDDDGDVCVGCVKTYLLESLDDANCMSCSKPFDRDFLCANLGATWVNGIYRKRRSAVAVEREIARMASSQPAAKHLLKVEHEEQELLRIQAEFNSARDKLDQKKRELHHLKKKSTHERKQFIKPCGRDGCKGFLSTAYKCGLCDYYSCSKCHVVKGNDKDAPHGCNPDDIASVREIAKTTRDCPGCGAATFKTDGCDQMFCTVKGCETAFSFRTGRRETGVIHNPHYFEMRRRGELAGGGGGARAVGDVQCGGPPSDALVIGVCGFAGGLNECEAGSHAAVNLVRFTYRGTWAEKVLNDFGVRAHRHFTAVVVNPLRERVAVARDNEDVRVLFLLERIDKKKLEITIARREKKREKEQEMLHVAELYAAVVQDQLLRITYGSRTVYPGALVAPNRRLPDDIRRKAPKEVLQNILEAVSEVHRVRTYCNQQLERIATNFKIKPRFIPEALGKVRGW
jgi:hypothetical protein